MGTFLGCNIPYTTVAHTLIDNNNRSFSLINENSYVSISRQYVVTGTVKLRIGHNNSNRYRKVESY